MQDIPQPPFHNTVLMSGGVRAATGPEAIGVFMLRQASKEMREARMLAQEMI